MPTFVVTYSLVEDMENRRTPYRQMHFQYLELSKSTGTLLVAGPLRDPYDGALFLLETDSKAAAHSWATNDPYVQAGLVNGFSVREMTVAVAKWQERTVVPS